ncbi:MAG: DUF433 domain-containing protein [Bacteroidota bacterium]
MKHERIQADPTIMFGKPVIRGSRVTVEQVLRKLASGKTPDAFLEDHPHLTVEDVFAALAYAADYLAAEDLLSAA